MKIIISEEGKTELNRLNFEINESIEEILKYIPKDDLVGLGYILITDLPTDHTTNHKGVVASYFKKNSDQYAHIELFLKNIFGHIRNEESLKQMLPIQEYGLAQIIFHEIGHHQRESRSHGIRKYASENYAKSYTEKVLKNYIIYKANVINTCFATLYTIAKEKKLSIKIIDNMRAGWEKDYKNAIK